MKKQATKKKDPISTRFGAFFARTVPGSAVKLGRLSKKAGGGVANAAVNFKDGFVKGWEEV
jgi:hypothetical protein